MIFVHRGLNTGRNAGRNKIQHRRNRGSSFHRDRERRRQLNTGNKHMTEEEWRKQTNAQLHRKVPHPRYCLVCRKVKWLSHALNYRRLARLGTFFLILFFDHNNSLSVINQCWGNKNRPRWISGIKIGMNELLFVYFLHINHISCSSNIVLVLWPPAVTHRPLFSLAESRAVQQLQGSFILPSISFFLSFSACLTLIRCSWII